MFLINRSATGQAPGAYTPGSLKYRSGQNVCTVRQISPVLDHVRGARMPQHVRDGLPSHAAEAARTICQTRCRVNLCPPRARKRSGELLPPQAGRAAARYSLSVSCADFPAAPALFVTLTANQHVAAHQASDLRICALNDLRHPQRARIKHFQHGAITQAQATDLLGCARSRSRAAERQASIPFHRAPATWAAPSTAAVTRFQAWDRARSCLSSSK